MSRLDDTRAAERGACVRKAVYGNVVFRDAAGDVVVVIIHGESRRQDIRRGREIADDPRLISRAIYLDSIRRMA